MEIWPVTREASDNDCFFMSRFLFFFTGKEWGNIEGYPILCLHGFSDNCDSFEPLAPLLSERFRYIALDAPGHGKTSHVPQGSPMNYWELVCYIKRVIDHFNIRKMSILGHSMGGSTGFLVASLYPDIVDRLLTLDVIKPVCVPLQWQTQSKAEAIDLFLSNEKRLKDLKYQKSYTQEQLVNRYVEAMGGTISPEAVRVLMKRGSKATGNGFTYSHDPRMVISLSIIQKNAKFSIHFSKDVAVNNARRNRGTT